MNNGSVDVVFGGQAGSEGKGAIVGYMARRNPYAMAICTFMTNAGHTWIGDNGENVMVQQLPMGIVGQEIPIIAIGASSAITLAQLEKEINAFDHEWDVSSRLRIHPLAMIIEEQDVAYEKEGTKYLGSTSKGCGAALARKVMRRQDVRLARDIPWLRPFIFDTTRLAHDVLRTGGDILAEGSQGFDLDMNHGIAYPYCTSRQTTPAQVMADLGVPYALVRDTVAVLRSYPIRVGHVVENGVEVGNSGPFGGKELTWEQITERSGSTHALLERTTVTKRVRRIFEIDYDRLNFMCDVTMPSVSALTFGDYVDASIYGISTRTFIGMLKLGHDFSRLATFVRTLGEQVPMLPVPRFVKTGPMDCHTIDFGSLRTDEFHDFIHQGA